MKLTPGYWKVLKRFDHKINLEETLDSLHRSKPCKNRLSSEWFGKLKCKQIKLMIVSFNLWNVLWSGSREKQTEIGPQILATIDWINNIMSITVNVKKNSKLIKIIIKSKCGKQSFRTKVTIRTTRKERKRNVFS